MLNNQLQFFLNINQFTKTILGIYLLVSLLNAQTVDSSKMKTKSLNPYYKSPGVAMILSTIIPGGGQIYCQNYLKAIIISGTEVTLGYFAYQNHQKFTTTQNNSYRDKRNNFLWWLATIKVLSIADAYVSAQMYKFNEQMKLTISYSPSWQIGYQFKF